MIIQQVIQQKSDELHSLAAYQQILSGEINPIIYLKYLRELKFIHDYIDHKSDYKDFMDMRREMQLHVDILELVHDLYPAEISPMGIGEDYAIFNMFQSKEKANAHAYIHYKEYLENAEQLKDMVPGKGRLYTFENKNLLIQHLEENKPSETFADECAKAYNVRIDILKELSKLL
jgi:hypothetical protein